MTEKFTIHLEPRFYGDDDGELFKHKPFVNSYGRWTIIAGVREYVFFFRLKFIPAQFQTDKALKDLDVSVGMSYNGGEPLKERAPLFQDPGIRVCSNKREGPSIYSFDLSGDSMFYESLGLIVEIDASSLFPYPPPESTSLAGVFNQMFEDEKLADITFQTEDGKNFKASRFILARSPVFDAMLNNHDTKEAQESKIEIKDIQHEVLKEMIRYLYSNYIPMMQEMALELLIAADKYNLPGLLRECTIFLQGNISIANFASILDTAEKLNVADLKEEAIMFIIENHDNALDSADWKALEVANMPLGMEVMKRCYNDMKKKMEK